MKDSDPRPMPLEVQRAYREPIDLQGLLAWAASSMPMAARVYGWEDRLVVRGALLESLLARHGDAWIAVGSREERVSTLVKSYGARASAVTKAIELLLDVPDYGGREETLPLLAQAMQPGWAAWWSSFAWNDFVDVTTWRQASTYVLGSRQLSWLAAQYARTAIESLTWEDREVCLRAIEAAEAWAQVPSKSNRQATIDLADIVDVTPGAYADVRAATAATYAADAARDAANADARYAASAAANATSPKAPLLPEAYARLASLTKRLITPTLVTSASRGLHASGGLRQAAMPGVAGAALGASAVLFARRI